MKTKWLGAAAWSAREAHAGDRLPYARLLDGNTVLLRDGLKARTVVVGENFTFGAHAAGTADTMRELGAKYGKVGEPA